MSFDLTPGVTVSIAPPALPGVTVVVPVPGPPGTAGPAGPPGPGSGSGGSGPFVFTQSTPAASWPIAHGLGHVPQVTVLDASGNRLIADLAYSGTTSVTVTHAAPLAGAAYLL